MKVLAISDTHRKLSKLKLPDADVLIHSGDALGAGDMPELGQFCEDSKALKGRYKLMIFVPGNHEKELERMPLLSREMLESVGWTVLIDQPVVFEGVKFYGSPWTLVLRRSDSKWAFKRTGKEIQEYWNGIPEDTDVLITHQPPYGIADRVMDADYFDPDSGQIGRIRNLGCDRLLKRVIAVKPKVHIFGHVHWSGGEVVKEHGVTFINAACLNEAYIPVRGGMLFEV